MAKAMEPHSIIAYEMNGEPIPKYHGFPVRIVCPGSAASTSHKWLQRIWVRDVVHDGEKMLGDSYRVPRYPVAPGANVPAEDIVIMESMLVKSVITSPQAGTAVAGRTLAVRGHA
jgi:DMSO/TMAO reductase YedYZ molybdopterin-dependent catalytic subunit